MIRQETTMIISFIKEDVNAYKYNLPPSMCIISATVERKYDWQNTLQLASDVLRSKLGPFGEKWKLFLWVKTDNYTSSRFRRNKHIWNNQNLKWLRKDQCILHSHKDNDEEFYSATASVDKTQLESCLDFVRTNKESFLFALNDENKDMDLLDSFLSENCSDFEKIVSFFFERNILFIRVFGNFDDKELSLDFFGQEQSLSEMFVDMAK